MPFFMETQEFKKTVLKYHVVMDFGLCFTLHTSESITLQKVLNGLLSTMVMEVTLTGPLVEASTEMVVPFISNEKQTIN